MIRVDINFEEEDCIITINGAIPQRLYTEECRCIFLLDNLVFKFDLDRDESPDWGQSACEVDIYAKVERTSKDDLKFFQPLVDFGNRWVCQEFISTIDDRPLDAWVVIDEIAQKYGLVDITPNKNWCVREDGQPVIYDYAW